MTLASILRDRVRTSPDHPALIVRNEIWTARRLHETAVGLAAHLRQIGLHPGDRLAILLPNCAEFTVACFAGHEAGCILVPLNPQLTADELGWQFSDAGVRLVVASVESLGAARGALDRMGVAVPVIAVGAVPSGPDPGVTRWDEACAAEPVVTGHDAGPEDTALILYTSGTTGRPKGVELSHGSLLWNARAVAAGFLPDGPATVALGVLPLFHSFGHTVIQHAVLLAGGTSVLLPRFTPAAAMEAIHRHAVTFLAAVPVMYLSLYRYVEELRLPVPVSLRQCISGAAPMPAEVMRAFEACFGVAVLEGYGLSETSPVASQNRIGRPRKAGSIGIPLDGVEFRLVDDGGQVLGECGVRGEIEIRGPLLMKGYWNQLQATAEALHDGWLRTGDIATRDEDGDYFIVDRKKDLILHGGFNVSPREVEEVLLAHPAVADAAVVGVPDHRLDEEVVAVVVLCPGVEVGAESLIAHCRGRLAPYKVPRRVLFVSVLPRGPSGKLRRRMIRDQLAGDPQASMLPRAGTPGC